MYAELRRKVEVKKQRQSLEGQLSSLIRIEGNNMSCKVSCYCGCCCSWVSFHLADDVEKTKNAVLKLKEPD